MNTIRQSDFRGIWAVAWRAFVFLPLMLAVFVVLLAHIAGLFMLPFISGVCVYEGLWQYGLISLGIWLLLLWSWRRFRLHQQFQSPPSVL